MRPVDHLVIFAKTPRLGRVKARLAADIGAVEATALYRRTLTSLVRRLGRDRRWRTVIAITPDGDASSTATPGRTRRMGQGRGDLGRRMDGAFRRLPRGRAVIVGSDIPDIQPRHIADAFRALGRYDAVFGPADDGGYWLIGLRRRPRVLSLFTGVRWSSPAALADTLANLGHGKRAALLDMLVDVDDGAALARWRAARRVTSGVP